MLAEGHYGERFRNGVRQCKPVQKVPACRSSPSPQHAEMQLQLLGRQNQARNAPMQVLQQKTSSKQQAAVSTEHLCKQLEAGQYECSCTAFRVLRLTLR